MVLGNLHDFTTDWWALGCIAYEMVIGIPPFYDKNPTKVSVRIIRKT